MLLQRWDPLFDFRRRHYIADRVRHGFPQTVDAVEPKRWSIALDAIEEDEKLVVRASLPGIDPDEIKVTIEDGVLTIDGETKVDEEGKVGNYLIRERRTGSFHRSVRLPDSVDVDQAETNYDEGVLTVAFPKAESKRAKQLTVTSGKALKGDSK
jgi:HSP20 family protein